MAHRLTHPDSTQVLLVDDDRLPTYISQGWQETPEPTEDD